jgi:hypothetical protein
MKHGLAPFWATALRRRDAPPGVFAAAIVFDAGLIIHAAVVHNFPQHETNLPE